MEMQYDLAKNFNEKALAIWNAGVSVIVKGNQISCIDGTAAKPLKNQTQGPRMFTPVERMNQSPNGIS